MNVIELRGIGKTFTDRTEPTVALQNINLVIQSGEFVSIIGPSGSGKSTLMNLLGLLDSPSEGQYLLDGTEVAGLKDRKLARIRREKIGFVFQSFNLLPRLTVLGNVELPLIYAKIRAGKRRKRALELLKLVGLGDRAGYRPNQISGGQTQRVAIARALANEPSLVLADEPTGNLDTKSSNAIIEELRRLNRETGATIIIVTHNPEIAELTDRTVTVRDGAIVSDQANHRPAHRAQRPSERATDEETQVGAEEKSPEVARAGSVTGPTEERESVRGREGELDAAHKGEFSAAHKQEALPHHDHQSGHVLDLRRARTEKEDDES
jgi:putative ABC transport system ATP-binding protein